jgi:hypothetical protein
MIGKQPELAIVVGLDVLGAKLEHPTNESRHPEAALETSLREER